MRLFTALWPDEAVGADVDALLARHLDPASWRPVAPARRHVTLCFHADADPQERRDALRTVPVARVVGLRLRCRGAGRFGDALWLGVEPDDPDRLAALVVAAGDDPATHVGHLTVARRRSGGRRVAPRTAGDAPLPVPPGVAAHEGPWWSPAEVTLVAGGQPYRVVDRVVLR